jgi:hypothetical protein
MSAYFLFFAFPSTKKNPVARSAQQQDIVVLQQKLLCLAGVIALYVVEHTSSFHTDKE